MATASPTGKSVNHYKLFTLINDQGTLVVRNLFDEAIGNVPLHQFLAQEKKTIQSLRKKGVITNAQYDLLFPPSGNPPHTTADFDFTLVVYLLRASNACGLNPNFNWNASPHPGDKSLEADLKRLKKIRNALARIPSTTAIDDTEFHQKWSEIEQVLLRLNGLLQYSIPKLQQRINDLKNRTLFQEEQNRNNEKVDDHGYKNKPGRKEDISPGVKLDEGGESSKKSSTPTTDQTCKEKATEWKQGTDFASKKGSTHSTDQTGSDKTTKWKQDINAWRMCIEKNDKKEAESLIRKKILPDHEMLNKAATSFRSDRQVLKIIGDEISLYIKAESNDIINVYAGYKHVVHELVEEYAFVFAVITTSNIDVENKFGYTLEQICVHKVNSSQENKDITLMERKYPMKEEDIIKAEKVVAYNSQELIKKHKNITRISVSWIKSRRYGTDNASMEREVCISLYVPKKGLIPIIEKSFPDTLDGFPVDVREGVCIPYQGSRDFHDSIKIGCAISGHSTADQHIVGTLGGFFEKEETVYGLTCAHLFLQNQIIKSGLESKGTWEAPHTDTQDPSNYVYQPTPDTEPFGSLVQAVVSSGDRNTSGVDAAVFNFKKRHPNSGEFPDANNGRNAGFGEETPMLFNSGKLSRTVHLNDLVVKHGCSTDITNGSVRARCVTAVLYIHPDLRCQFYNQYEITTSDDTNFATYGDSGAMVFTVENNELKGIGIVEGGMGDVCFVTPIFDVFSALGMTDPPYEMKRFI